MSEEIGQSINEFSLYRITGDETIEDGKVMVTSGIEISGDGCLIIEGMVRVV